MAIDTACSSSLVAVSSGRSALLLGASAEALAGGVTLMLSPTTMAMYAVAGVGTFQTIIIQCYSCNRAATNAVLVCRVLVPIQPPL